MKSEPTRAARHDALEIFKAGIAAADPFSAVQNCLCFDRGLFSIRLDSGEWRSGRWPKIHLIAFGKAACAMARAAEARIPDSLRAGRGIAVTNYENVAALSRTEVFGAGHPLPDQNGLHAAGRIVAAARRAEAGDLLLALVSGGGSALIPSPAEPVSLADKSEVTALLLGSGASINEINTVRKHLSNLKGGGLARLAAPADLHALILSDVLGDDLSAIASGPTVPDPTTFDDAIGILHGRGIWDNTPPSVRDRLKQGASGKRPETPKPNDPLFQTAGHTLIGSNTLSLKAAAERASRLGYQTHVYDARLCGIARDAAADWVKSLAGRPCHEPVALLAGGETTVRLTGKGRGGRNQEMALAFALAAEKAGLVPEWVFLSGGTDGRDGPTDAAGGLVDAGSLNRMRSRGIAPEALLADNDSYPALEAAGDLVITGATGTNVADLQVLLIRPKPEPAPR